MMFIFLTLSFFCNKFIICKRVLKVAKNYFGILYQNSIICRNCEKAIKNPILYVDTTRYKVYNIYHMRGGAL